MGVDVSKLKSKKKIKDSVIDLPTIREQKMLALIYVAEAKGACA